MILYHAIQDDQLVQLDDIQSSSWINISPPFAQSELEELATQLDIPLDFLTDSLDLDERSRYEMEDDGTRFILVNTPIHNQADHVNEALYVTVPIGIILKEKQVITICARNNPALSRFLEGRIKKFDPDNMAAFVLKIFEQIVMRYLECLKKLNLKRHLIEQELYDSAKNEELKQLLRVEKSLVYFVNSLSSNELLKMKMKRTDFLKIREQEEESDLFEDVIIDNSQALEMANVNTNILSNTMEAYASMVSNNVNRFIQRLTIITIILMVPTLVASFYGMNLKNLPFEKSNFAFYYIILISGAFSLVLIWFFRSKRWF